VNIVIAKDFATSHGITQAFRFINPGLYWLIWQKTGPKQKQNVFFASLNIGPVRLIIGMIQPLASCQGLIALL